MNYTSRTPTHTLALTATADELSIRRLHEEQVPGVVSAHPSEGYARLLAPQTIHSLDLWTLFQPMSALGQKQTFEGPSGMSALPPRADIFRGGAHVR